MFTQDLLHSHELVIAIDTHTSECSIFTHSSPGSVGRINRFPGILTELCNRKTSRTYPQTRGIAVHRGRRARTGSTCTAFRIPGLHEHNRQHTWESDVHVRKKTAGRHALMCAHMLTGLEGNLHSPAVVTA